MSVYLLGKKVVQQALGQVSFQKGTLCGTPTCGGQGTGEDISEAACMKAWLSERGIKEERMILEDKSASTRENLIFSDQRTGCAGENVGIISNNFHIYRALRLAEAWGYEQAEGIAASSDPIMQPHYVVREVFALVKECISGNI